jgi:hypothetical protein
VVGDGGDSPTVNIPFEVYKIFAVMNAGGLHGDTETDQIGSIFVIR